MKNKDNSTKEILEIAVKDSTGGFAVDKRTRKVCACSTINCSDCYMQEVNYPYPQGGCTKNFIHWANSEYVERKEFTEEERAILNALNKIEWVAKDKNGKTYGFNEKPHKDKKSGFWKNQDDPLDCIYLSGYTSCKFEAIKWEDTEPTSRAEILGGAE